MADLTVLELKTRIDDNLTKARMRADTIKAENREMTDGETDEVNALLDAVMADKELMGKKQKRADINDRLETLGADLNRSDDRRSGGGSSFQDNQDKKGSAIIWGGEDNAKIRRVWQPTQKYGSQAYATAYNKFMKGASPEAAFRGLDAMSTIRSDDDERAGYFITSEQLSTEFLKEVDDAVHVQAMSRMIMMIDGPRQLAVRCRTAKASSFTRGGELTDVTSSFDTSLKYGKRHLTPEYMHGGVKISRDLIRHVPGAESMVLEELALDASEVLEQEYLYGDGNHKSLGLMVPSSNGITSARDFSRGCTASTFNFDSFQDAKYQLKEKYRSKASIMMHRYFLRDIALLKDGESRYLWEQSRTKGEPDRILGMTFVESEWMPSVASTGLYFALMGDFSYYWIVWDMMMEMQRLVETAAKTNEYEYIFRFKNDAQPMMSEAFARLKFA